ncbi:MAG: cytochrome c biogenesis protein CcsA [Nitrospinae bacterium]|nr:cytochrome c biogenesis protein CcsA [Nitrospinota bacterium]
MKFLFGVTLSCYLLGMAKYFLYLAIRRKILFIIATVFIAVGFVFHTGILVLRSIETGHGPYTTTFEYYTFFSWAIVLVYLVAEVRYKIKDLGSFVIPIAFISLAYAVFQSWHTETTEPVIRFWLTIHRTLSFIGYAALTLTFGVGIMYIIQEKQLKSKHLGAFYYRLPSLEVLDDINKKAVDVGFPLITFGFISGIIWAWQRDGYFSLDFKRTILMIITWTIYGTLFFGRIIAGWRGRRAARFVVYGFMAVIIAYMVHIY